MSEKKLNGNMNAEDWAKEFMRIFSGHVCGENEKIDEGSMIGWFANAILTGYDSKPDHDELARKLDIAKRALGLMLLDEVSCLSSNPKLNPYYIALDALKEIE